MAKVEILLGTLVLDKGKKATVGDEVTIADDEAEALIAAGIVRAIGRKKPADDNSDGKKPADDKPDGK